MYKVILVDDEPVIRQYFLTFMDWQAMDCSVILDTDNGLEVKEFLESNPWVDIIVSDIKMPGMDGIALSKYVYEHHPHIKTVILTAYADFSYAQAAIQYGVVDFIIKSNPDHKMMEAIGKCKLLIQQQRIKDEKLRLLESKVTRSMSIVNENLLKDMLSGIISSEESSRYEPEALKSLLTRYSVAVYELRKPFACGDGKNEEAGTFIHTVRNFIDLALKDYRHYTIIMNKDRICSVVSSGNENEAAHLRDLLGTCKEMMKIVEQFMQFEISIGLSRMQETLALLSLAYRQALDSLSGSFYACGNTVSVFSPTDTRNSSSIPCRTYRQTDEISRMIRKGDTQNASAQFTSLMEACKMNRESIEYVKISCISICSFCSRLLAELDLTPPAGLENEAELYKKIHGSSHIRQLSGIMAAILREACQSVSGAIKHPNVIIREADDFMQAHYEKSITLQEIADAVHISSSYLSRLYKKETGESIISVLNRLRIDKAKELLKNPANKISQVALDVGIKDPAYFTHVFTRYAKISPTDFRKT